MNETLAEQLQKAYAAKGMALEVLRQEVPNLEQGELPWKLVTHMHPDTDAHVCIWAATRFLAGKDAEITYHFVRSGESLSENEMKGFRVLHMDTGLGELDQHGMDYTRTSSFELMCRKYGWLDDEALRPILELTIATDNVEKVDPTSIHYVMKGLHYHFWDKGSKESDWNQVTAVAFLMLDVLYGQWKQNIKSSEDLAKFAKFNKLRGGVRFTTMVRRPQLRVAAFENGADVVMWTKMLDYKNPAAGFEVGIQSNPPSQVTLQYVMSDIRHAEAAKRGLALENVEFLEVGKDASRFGGWYLHGSLNLIVCGSRTHPLEDGEQTLLSPQEIINIVINRLNRVQMTERRDNRRRR